MGKRNSAKLHCRISAFDELLLFYTDQNGTTRHLIYLCPISKLLYSATDFSCGLVFGDQTKVYKETNQIKFTESKKERFNRYIKNGLID